MALCKFYNRKERKAFPGVGLIMHVSGCSRRSVFRALNELKEKGLIVIRKKSNIDRFDNNIYILPDFLFFELSQVKTPSAGQALASAIQALLSATSDTPLMPDRHTNYIINHITNIANSFNSKELAVNDDPGSYREMLSKRMAEYWQNRSSEEEKSRKHNS